MIYPPRLERHVFDGKCHINDLAPCSDCNCNSCEIALKYYETELERSFTDVVLPKNHRCISKKYGVWGITNENMVIMKLDCMDDVMKLFIGRDDFPKHEYDSVFMEQDMLKGRYPYWYALKTLKKLGEPLKYIGEPNRPLIVEYSDCIYMVAPVVIEEDVLDG